MLPLNTNGFTEAEVRRAVAGLDQPPQYRVRAELLDLDNVRLYEITSLQTLGRIRHNTDEPIKRGADLVFVDDPRDENHPAPLPAFIAAIVAESRLFHLRLSDPNGNFADSSGNGRTFTANGGITRSVDSLVAGDLVNDAITLNGSTGYLSLADAAWMDVSRVTLALAWRGTGVSQTLIDRDDGGSNRFWRLDLDSTGALQFAINFTTGSPTRKVFSTGVKINDGLPHLVHAMYDGALVLVVLDGKRILKVAETRTMATGTLGINIGRNLAGANFSSGTFDETGMLNRALSAREFRDEFQAWSSQIDQVLFDRDRGDKIKVYVGIRMDRNGDDGTPWAEWPQIVGMLPTFKRDYSSTGVTMSVTVQDQTRILADAKFQIRITLLAGANFITGTNGVLAIAQLAGFNTAAWAVTPTTKVATADIDFEITSSLLEAINYLLLSINYRALRFTGDGAGVIEPNILDIDRAVSDTIATGPETVISDDGLTTEIEQRQIVNEVIVFNGNPDVPAINATATNDKVRSPSSTVYISPNTRRVQVDTPDQATADALARQQLSEGTIKNARRVRYKSLWRPFHDDRDKFTLDMPEIRASGDFIEDEWTLPLDARELQEHSVLTVVDVTT